MKIDPKQYEKRRRGVMRVVARSLNLRAVMITDTIDIRYLTGCTEGAACLLMVGNDAVIFTKRMFLDVIGDQAPGVDVRLVTTFLHNDVESALRKMKHRAALGFQESSLVVSQYRGFEKAMGRRKLVSIGDAVVAYRAVKEDTEVRMISKCVRIAESAFKDLTGRGRRWMIGRTEKQLAAELEYLMRMGGADSQAFANGIIVAAGPNSASCHHVPTNRKVRDGEAVLFDWGAKIDSYQSDITRVVFVGRIPERLAEIYPVVQEANRVGVAAIRPGVRCHTVAKTSWGVVRDAGYGELIRHGLGHGLGMQTHESPFLGDGARYNPKMNPVLKKGMVVTVEPGIYFHGSGGIRIEDDVLVTASGRRSLTTLPRDMERLTLR